MPRPRRAAIVPEPRRVADASSVPVAQFEDPVTMKDQSLYYGDCLDWMRGWPDESVDLIYLDPPFNSNADYNILFGRGNGTPAQVRGFVDTWKWDEAAADRALRFRNAVSNPMHRATLGFEALLGQSGMLAYLTYMGERLVEMRRLLKPSGSLYLHCDDTASHYLKLLLDSVFGAGNFRNDIAWRRATAHNDPRRFGRILDRVLFYAKTDRPYWAGSEVNAPKTEAQLRAAYPSEDERGRYRSADLTGARVQPGAPSAEPWRDYNAAALGRHWSVPRTGQYAEYIERNFIPGYRSIEDIQERLDALDAAGLIHHPVSGKWPGLKRYAAAEAGNPPQNLIMEPIGFTNFSARRGEHLGFPTQKPLGLLKKLIPASCPPGGLVLDPFCGCGTTIVAAHDLQRRWIGIDISATAIDIVQRRRFRPMGIEVETFGIPQDLANARKLASERPLDFEAWSVTRILGLAPNEQRSGDRGIDGRGRLIGTPKERRSRLVLAQVKGGQAFQISAFRDFLHVINRDDAAAGVYVTLENVASSQARAEARAAGMVTVGADVCPRVQFWSIEDYFNGQMPRLPTLADPHTGRPIRPALLS